MNVEVLAFLLQHDHYLEGRAHIAGIDVRATIWVSKLLIRHSGDLAVLSEEQRFHYDHVIKPLIEAVPCDGQTGMCVDTNGNWVDTCQGNGFIDDKSLLQSYLEGEFKCGVCRSA